MLSFFSEKPGHKNILRKLVVLWAIVIVGLCFLPSDEIPDTSVPFADKWGHFIMFGLLSFLWSSSLQGFKRLFLIIIFTATVFFGWLIEVLQGQLTFLGRSKDNMDIAADAVGGLLGVVIFYIGYTVNRKKEKR